MHNAYVLQRKRGVWAESPGVQKGSRGPGCRSSSVAGLARFAYLAWQKRGTEAESGGAPGPRFYSGTPLVLLPCVGENAPEGGVLVSLRRAGLWQDWHVSLTWRGRNEAQKRSRAAPQGPVLFRDSAFLATLRG